MDTAASRRIQCGVSALAKNQTYLSPKEALVEGAYQRIAKYTKGQFKVVSTEQYRLHQRCATQARKGRVMLAGDLCTQVALNKTVKL